MISEYADIVLGLMLQHHHMTALGVMFTRGLGSYCTLRNHFLPLLLMDCALLCV